MGRLKRMKIFKILRDSENFMEFSTDLEDMLDEIGPEISELEFMHFSRHNLKLGYHWGNFFGTFKKVRAGAQQRPDISCWRGATLILSPTSKEILEQHLTPYGEFLPISCDQQGYFIFNCLELAKIDPNLSQQAQLEHGLIEFKKITFDQSSTMGKLVFKSQDEGCTAIFCSEAFKSLINIHNLNGLKFSESLTEIF